MIRASQLIHTATIERPDQTIADKRVVLGATPITGTHPCRFDHEGDDSELGPIGKGQAATYQVEFLPELVIQIGDRVTWVEDGRTFETTGVRTAALLNAAEVEAVFCVVREMES